MVRHASGRSEGARLFCALGSARPGQERDRPSERSPARGGRGSRAWRRGRAEAGVTAGERPGKRSRLNATVGQSTIECLGASPEAAPLGLDASNAACVLRSLGHRGARRPHAQPQERQPSPCPPASSSSSPASAARASRRSPSTPSTPKASAATSSRSPPTPASSWSGWRSRTWTASTTSARPSPSARRTRSATRAPPWAPSPRFTTTCGCCSPAWARPSAGSAARKSIRETAEVVADRLLRLPEGTRLLIGYDLPLVDLKRRARRDDAAEPEDAEGRYPRLASAPSVSSAYGGCSAHDRVARHRRYLLRAGAPAPRRDSAACCIDGQAVTIDDLPPDALKGRTSVGVVVDRLRIEGDLRSRLTDSIEMSYQEGGGAAWAVEVTTDGRTGSAPRVLRALRVPHLRHHLRGSAAAALLVQQPVRRLPHVPRLRQRDRAGPGSGRAGSGAVDQPGRDRAVDEAALPLAAWRR